MPIVFVPRTGSQSPMPLFISEPIGKVGEVRQSSQSSHSLCCLTSTFQATRLRNIDNDKLLTGHKMMQACQL
jgi:hypothetical protein